MKEKKAIVLLSGGLDSATCLYTAREQGFTPIAISFDYGQRHRTELNAAQALAKNIGADHRIVAVDLRAIGGSALTSSLEVPKGGANLSNKTEIPVTYVPVRNLIFLSLASALAETEEASAIFIGINSVDYSGYPDCRPDFIEAFAKSVALASKIGREGRAPTIFTPLQSFSKADIAKEAMRLGVPVAKTWSCYDPQRNKNRFVPCEECDACLLRRDGFIAAGLDLSKEEIFGSPQELP